MLRYLDLVLSDQILRYDWQWFSLKRLSTKEIDSYSVLYGSSGMKEKLFFFCFCETHDKYSIYFMCTDLDADISYPG